MNLEDFEWGMNEMIKDPDFLYSSMTRDLYFLGIVLATKVQIPTYLLRYIYVRPGRGSFGVCHCFYAASQVNSRLIFPRTIVL